MDKQRLNHNTILTDDAVAELLVKEADEASIRYSSMGLEAFKSKYASDIRDTSEVVAYGD
jgi:hypothetical protein